MNLLTVKVFAHCRWFILLAGAWLISFQLNAASEEPIPSCGQQGSRAELNQCLEKELVKLEQQQQQAYLQLAQQAAELEAISEGAKGVSLALTDSRESFQRFRDSYCRWEMKMMASGSGAGSQYLRCKIQLTENDLSRLQQWLKPSP